MTQLLDPHNSVLLVVDVQERFTPVIHESQKLIDRCRIMVEAAALLHVPVVVSEQYPKGLGHTVSEIQEVLPGVSDVLEKSAFGCLGDEVILKHMQALNRRQVMLCGIEAHVCVSQSAHQLLDAGFRPYLITDAISSRTEENRGIGLRRMIASGAAESCTEMALFELMQHSKHPQFKAVQALIK